jgi:DNA repair protein RadD
VCEHVNDIAARFCSGCKTELVNPNDKLIEFFTAHKKDPTLPQTDPVVSIDYVRGISRAGNDMLTANIVTSRRKFSVYLLENNNYAAAKKAAFSSGTGEFARTPRTITYVKDGDFWKVLGFDRPSDEEELQRRLCEV